MKIAEEGGINIKYLEMLKALENNSETKDLPDDSELRQLPGCRDKISTVILTTGIRLIVKKWNENIDPKDNEGGDDENPTPHTYWVKPKERYVGQT